MIQKINLKILYLGIISQILFYSGVASPIAAYVGTFFVLISVFSFNKNQVLLLFAFLVPNQRIFVFSEGGYSILNIILVILLCKLLYEKWYVNNKILITTVIIVFYSLIVGLINNEFLSFAVAIKSLLIVNILSYYLISSKVNILFYKEVILFFILGSFFTGFIGLFYGGDFLLGSDDRFTAGDYNNANILGTTFSFSLALLLLLFRTESIKNIQFYILSISILFLGFLTQSRSFMLAVALISLVYIPSIIKSKSGILIGFLFLIFISSNFNSSIFGKVFNSALERIINPKNEDLSGGRTSIWKEYTERIFSDEQVLLFGKGSLDTNAKFGLDQVAHNSFIETIAAWGIIGLILFLILFFQLFKQTKLNIKAISNSKLYLVAFLPLLIYISNSMTGHSFINMGSIFQFVLWIMVFIIYYNSKNSFSISNK